MRCMARAHAGGVRLRACGADRTDRLDSYQTIQAAGTPCRHECVHLTHLGEKGAWEVWGAGRAAGMGARQVGARAAGRAATCEAAGVAGAEASGCGPASEGAAGGRRPRARRRTRSSCGVVGQQQGWWRGQGSRGYGWVLAEDSWRLGDAKGWTCTAMMVM